jgi:hypothetical protein
LCHDLHREAIIIARKLGLMVAFFLFFDEEAWLMGTAVVTVALVSHVAASPYEDTATDVAEFATLVAQLLLLVAAPVFKVINDPEDPARAAQAATLMKVLEMSSLVVILSACCYALYAELRVIRHVNRAPHYSLTFLRKLKRPEGEDETGNYDIIGSSEYQLKLDNITQSHGSKQKQIQQLVGTFSNDEMHLLTKLDFSYSADYKERALHKKVAETRQTLAELRRQLDGLYHHHQLEHKLVQLASLSDIIKASKQLQAMKRKQMHLKEETDVSEGGDRCALIKNAISEIQTIFCELDAHDKQLAEDFKRTLDSLPQLEIQTIDARGVHHDGNKGKARHPFNHLSKSQARLTTSAEQDAEIPGQSGYVNPLHNHSMGLDQTDPDPQANTSTTGENEHCQQSGRDVE